MRKIMQFYNDDDHRQVKKDTWPVGFPSKYGSRCGRGRERCKDYRPASPGSAACGKLLNLPLANLGGISKSLCLKPLLPLKSES
jgi:hypothetical protein